MPLKLSYHAHRRRIARIWRVLDAIYEVTPPINGEWKPYEAAWLERIHKCNLQAERLERLAAQQYERSKRLAGKRSIPAAPLASV